MRNHYYRLNYYFEAMILTIEGVQLCKDSNEKIVDNSPSKDT